jgi:mRNA interferase RelE/StbE
MNIEQSAYFKRSYKKLRLNELEEVNNAIRHVLGDPLCGEQKKGDLAGVRVHKFRIKDQQFLLAYEFNKKTFYLLALGVHENFYRDLKKSR